VTAEIIMALLASATAITGGLLSVFTQLYIKRKKDKQLVKDDLIDRINVTTKNLNQAMDDISLLQNEIKGRIETVEKLRKEATEAERIIELSAEQVQAVRSAINTEMSKNSKKDFWKGVMVNFVFFIMGALVSFLISTVV
jgi:uncharacterized membrane protein YdfJ with MMPL/SSD domain